MMTKYNRIGQSYNQTRQADPYLLARIHHFLMPTEDKTYLDIGCGTGNYTAALEEGSKASFIGVDPSSLMLEQARKRSTIIEWKQGEAEAIPLADAQVDGAIASLTLHHWTDLSAGFKELYRVVRSGGQLVIFTARPKQMEAYWLRHYFPIMMADSIAQMPSLEAICTAAEAGGWELKEMEAYFVQENLQDLFLYAGKDRPNLYLKPEVQAGISSFTDLSRAAEVEQGLKQLEADLKTGYWQEVRAAYNDALGDYLFMQFRKP